ncbi:hypothetical protein EZS27_035113, partial [termite gut metagenome]
MPVFSSTCSGVIRKLTIHLYQVYQMFFCGMDKLKEKLEQISPFLNEKRRRKC